MSKSINIYKMDDQQFSFLTNRQTTEAGRLYSGHCLCHSTYSLTKVSTTCIWLWTTTRNANPMASNRDRSALFGPLSLVTPTILIKPWSTTKNANTLVSNRDRSALFGPLSLSHLLFPILVDQQEY